jgi:hypothetical protein
MRGWSWGWYRFASAIEIFRLDEFVGKVARRPRSPEVPASDRYARRTFARIGEGVIGHRMIHGVWFVLREAILPRACDRPATSRMNPREGPEELRARKERFAGS